MPFLVADGGVANGGRRRIGVLAPADVANGQAFRAFDAPLDADVGRATLLRRTRPGVVDTDTAQAVRVFQNVSADAVRVRELRARVGADTAIDSFRIAKPMAERVEMMDRHDAKREPAEGLVPVHPVWNATHVHGR